MYTSIVSEKPPVCGTQNAYPAKEETFAIKRVADRTNPKTKLKPKISLVGWNYRSASIICKQTIGQMVLKTEMQVIYCSMDEKNLFVVQNRMLSVFRHCNLDHGDMSKTEMAKRQIFLQTV